METQRNADLLDLARAGVPYGRIGELYGISRQRVYFLARTAGVTRNLNKGKANTRRARAARAARRQGFVLVTDAGQ